MTAFLGVEHSLTGRRWIGPGSEVDRQAEAMTQESALPRALCQTLARLGVGASEASAYLTPTLRDLLPDPRSLRDMKWLANAKSRKLKELQREAKTKRKAVQAEVAEEVARRPVYAAEEFLRRGIVEGPDGERIDVPSGHKLAVPALRDMYGE